MIKSTVGKLNRGLFWLSSHKIISLLFVVTLVVIGWFVYGKVAQEMNRQAFKSARHTIDVVYADIVKQVGAPDNFQKINECSRSHLELSEGPLSCSVNTKFIYGATNKSQADQLSAKIKTVVAAHSKIFKPTTPPKSEIPITPSVHDVSDREVNYFSSAGLPCAITYEQESINSLLIYIGCTSKSRSQLYLLSN